MHLLLLVAIVQLSAPTVITRVNPEYTNEARAAQIQGTVVLEAVISEEGRPSITRVVRSLGYGLDESAVSSVTQWRFKPGMKDGKPVKTTLNIEVSFNLMPGNSMARSSGPRASVLTVAVDPGSASVVYAGTRTSFFKSVDAGNTWHNTGKFDNVASIAVDPQNPAIIYACSTTMGVYKSVDAGETWVVLELPAARAVQIDPASSSTLYVATVRGISKSYDAGKSWIEILPGTNFTKLTINPRITSSILAVTDTGDLFNSTDGGQHWQFAGAHLLEQAPIVLTSGAVTLRPADPIDSTLTAPKLLAPADGAVLDVYPRDTTLRWAPSPNAAYYLVQWDYGYGGGNWNSEQLQSQNAAPFATPVHATEFTFQFVGAQPGRWRVFPVNEMGVRGTPSEWRTFRYIK